MHIKQEIGRKGEDIVCKYLKENNYIIVERNFTCRQGEIDIIAKDKDTQEIVLIEVKTRQNKFFGTPAEAVVKKKQKHILQVGKYYLYQRHLENNFIRLDVIEVYLKQNDFQINHIKQAFVNNM